MKFLATLTTTLFSTTKIMFVLKKKNLTNILMTLKGKNWTSNNEQQL